METRESRVRRTRLSCGKNVSRTATMVLTKLPEDGSNERTHVAHEGRQNTPIIDQTYQNAMTQVSISGYNA